MDGPTQDPLIRLARSPGLRKAFGLAFLLPQIVFGAVFAGVPLWVFVVYWWPAFERYTHGEFRPGESAVVLFGALVFGGFFFLIGAVMFLAGLRGLARLFAGSVEDFGGNAPTQEEIAESRSRVMGFPRVAGPLRSAAEAVSTDQLSRLMVPMRTPDGFYELRSRPAHLTLGIALLVFAAFWNGVISFGISDMVGWSAIGLIFAIFMLPFVLVGLGLAGGAIYFLFALLQPELTVRVKADPEQRTIKGTWSFSRLPSRLRTMAVVLKVTEKHVKGKGEDETTRSIPVLEQTLIEGASLESSERGEFSYRWPEGLELPQRSGERRVAWVIHFRAHSGGLLDFRFWVPVII